MRFSCFPGQWPSWSQSGPGVTLAPAEASDLRKTLPPAWPLGRRFFHGYSYVYCDPTELDFPSSISELVQCLNRLDEDVLSRRTFGVSHVVGEDDVFARVFAFSWTSSTIRDACSIPRNSAAYTVEVVVVPIYAVLLARTSATGVWVATAAAPT